MGAPEAHKIVAPGKRSAARGLENVTESPGRAREGSFPIQVPFKPACEAGWHDPTEPAGPITQAQSGMCMEYGVMSTAGEDQKRRWRFRLGAWALVTFMAIRLFISLQSTALATDEFVHIPAGYVHLTIHRFDFNPEHPPLIKMLSAVPLLILKPSLPGDPQLRKDWNDWFNFCTGFFYLPVAKERQIITVIAVCWLAAILCLKRSVDSLFLMLPMLLYGGFALIGNINIGIRHILPIFPFLFISAGDCGIFSSQGPLGGAGRLQPWVHGPSPARWRSVMTRWSISTNWRAAPRTDGAT